MALASMVIGSDLNRMRSQGPGNTGGGGGSSIPDAANNIWGSAIPGAEPAGSGTVASTSGSSMLNLSQQTGGTLALIDGTFSNDATAANKTVTVGNGADSGTNSGAAGNDAGSGINSGVGGGSAGQVSGNGTGSSGTTLTGGNSSVTTTIGANPGGFQPLRWMLLFPGPAPPTRHGVIPVTGALRARQPAPIPPASTAHSPISPISP